MLYQFRREPEAALKTAEEARSLCLEYRFDYYGAWSALVRAWTAEQGRLKEGVTAYDDALKEFEKTGAWLRMPHYLGLLAAIHPEGRTGRGWAQACRRGGSNRGEEPGELVQYRTGIGTWRAAFAFHVRQRTQGSGGGTSACDRNCSWSGRKTA